jgi:hypothetical protein
VPEERQRAHRRALLARRTQRRESKRGSVRTAARTRRAASRLGSSLASSCQSASGAGNMRARIGLGQEAAFRTHLVTLQFRRRFVTV